MSGGKVAFDYIAREQDEVNLKKGQSFRLLQTFDDGWWLVESNGRQGLAPSNYLHLEDSQQESSHSHNHSAKKAHQHKQATSHTPVATTANSPHTKELSRLQVLRQEAAVKIDNLRNAVDSYEATDTNTTTAESMLSPTPHSTKPAKAIYTPSSPRSSASKPSVHRVTNTHHASASSQRRHSSPLTIKANGEDNSSEAPSTELVITAIPKVSLDKSSIDYISRIVQERIHREFSVRDQRLLEKTHLMIQQALTDFASHYHLHQKEIVDHHPQPAAHGHRFQHHQQQQQQQVVHLPTITSLKSVSNDKLQTSKASPATSDPADSANAKVPRSAGSAISTNSHASYESRIPRMKLPKVSPTGGGEGGSRQHSHRQPKLLDAADGQQRLSMKKKGLDHALPPAAIGYQYKPIDSLQVNESVSYPQCRSNVTASSHDIDCIAQHGQTPFNTKLQLNHVFGYYGDSSRHNGLSVGKNIVWINESKFAYPAAAMIIVHDVNTTKQAFLTGHTDDVLAIAIYKSNECVMLVSTQIGGEGGIFLWNLSHLQDGETITHYTQTHLQTPHNALTIPSNAVRNMVNLDFSPDGLFLVAMVIEESKILYIFDWLNNTILARIKSGHVDNNCDVIFNPYAFTPFSQEVSSYRDNPDRLPGCYTLISRSAKQLKFWTLKQQISYDSSKKKSQSRVILHVLEGVPASNVSKGHQKNVDFTSLICTSSSSDAPQQQHQSQIFVGLSSGAVQIWMQILDEAQGDNLLSWSTRAKLLMVVEGVHENAICDLSFLPWQSQLLSCDINGVMNIWEVSNTFANNKQHQPMTHIDSVQIEESFIRCALWHPNGQQIVIGTASNSILSLSWSLGGSAKQQGNAQQSQRDFHFQSLMTSHTAKVRRVAVNHQVPHIFATISNDKTIKIWDGYQRRFITQLMFEKQVTAIDFSTDGYHNLILGIENGEVNVVRSESFVQFLQQGGGDGSVEGMGNDWVITQSKDLFGKLLALYIGHERANILSVSFYR